MYRGCLSVVDLAPALEDTGWCPFAAITGKPCLVCGGTRATIALFSGDLERAIEMNAFVTVSILILAVALVPQLPRKIRLDKSVLGLDIPRKYWSVMIIALALGWVWNSMRWV